MSTNVKFGAFSFPTTGSAPRANAIIDNRKKAAILARIGIKQIVGEIHLISLVSFPHIHLQGVCLAGFNAFPAEDAIA
jgi:hypothetical protein